MKKRVFVYGTLRVGQTNHLYLKEAKLLEKSVRAEGYELRSTKNFPFAYFKDDGSIVGDIYEVEQRIIEQEIDILEGVAQDLYQRHFDENIDAFIYVRMIDDRQRFEHIEGGDWLAYKEENKGE